MTWPTISIGARFVKSSATWTELGSFAERIETRSGRSKFLDRFTAGTIDAELCNDDRRFDPLNLSGPYVAAGVTQIEPMVQVFVSCTHAAVEYPIKFGFVDSWTTVTAPPSEALCRVAATDGFKLLARAELTGTESVGGTGYQVGRCITQIFPSTSWMSSAGCDQTSPQMTIPNYSPAAGTSVLAESQKLADNDPGDLFMFPEFIGGRWVDSLQFRPWHLRKISVPSKVWSDDPSGGQLLYESVVPLGASDDQFVTRVTGQRSGGVAQTASSAAALVANADVPSPRSNTALMLNNDSEVLDWASGIMHRFSAFETGFARMVVDVSAQDNDTLWAAVLNARIGNRITIVHNPPGGGTAISRDHFIEGIEHSIALPAAGGSRGEGWKVAFSLSDATRFSTTAWMVGHATRGKIGTASLG